jgi:YVTN family beta-propeller protein
LAALEERIEADLVLGGHADLVGELEQLVARHPLRERLRGQLMLALYRSGRQAESLRTYQETRRAFAEELGIEPSRGLQDLEQAILRQEPALDPPAGRRGTAAETVAVSRSPRGRTRFRRAVLVAPVAALVVAAATTIVALRLNGPSRPLTLAGDSVVAIDPATGAVAGEIPVGGRPAAVAVGEGSVWVGNRDDGTLLRIDPRSRKVLRTIGLGVEPYDVEVGADAVWVTSDVDAAVLRVDPALNDVVARIDLPPSATGVGAFDVAAGAGAVWVLHGRGLSRIDEVTNTAVDARVLRRAGPAGDRIGFGAGDLWLVTSWQGTLRRLDSRSGSVLQTISLEHAGPLGFHPDVAVAGNLVWVVSQDGQTVSAIDARTGRLGALIELSRRPANVAAGDEGIWVTAADGTVSRIDPGASSVATTISLGLHTPAPEGAIAVGEGGVWVAICST